MDIFGNMRIAATGMLMLAGLVAVCPHAAHGMLVHDSLPGAEAASASHDTADHGHDHDPCEYEVAHTHDVRLSCAPDELSSWIMAGYDHFHASESLPARHGGRKR